MQRPPGPPPPFSQPGQPQQQPQQPGQPPLPPPGPPGPSPSFRPSAPTPGAPPPGASGPVRYGAPGVPGPSPFATGAPPVGPPGMPSGPGGQGPPAPTFQPSAMVRPSGLPPPYGQPVGPPPPYGQPPGPSVRPPAYSAHPPAAPSYGAVPVRPAPSPYTGYSAAPGTQMGLPPPAALGAVRPPPSFGVGASAAGPVPGAVPFAGAPPAYGEPGVPSQPPPQSPRQRLLQQQQAAAGYAPAPGPYGYAQQQALVEDFESLTLTPQMGPGGATDTVADPAALPRPVGVPDVVPFTAAANSPPTFFRLTCNAIPASGSLRARWHLPLGAVLQPLARPNKGEEVPVVNFGPSGIVRCRRCRTYVNPYVTFTDGGRRWRCNVCSLLNEVPVEYFCALDANGRRQDADQRPELARGSVEFVAPQEYMVRPPMPPAYLFVIDVSANAVASGMLPVLCKAVAASLDRLPGDSRTRIGFVTFDSTLHFYNLKASLAAPQMLVVSDLEDPFLPLPDELLVNLSESRAVVDALLASLPAFFGGSANLEAALGPALSAAHLLLARLGGKVLLFQAGLPTLGPGRLRTRGDDPRLYGSDREHTLRIAEEAFYKKTAAEFSRVQIGVNAYLFANSYIDVASLGTLPRYTGGQVYFYPGFTPAADGPRFAWDLQHDLERETAWEAVMRIRCGKGLKISSFHGHFFIRSTDLLALPCVDEDKAFAIQIAHEEQLVTQQTVYFQCALLYTSSSGERRIRVHTVAAPLVADLGELYKAADCGAAVTVLAKLAVEKSLADRLEGARGVVTAKAIQALREYRQLHPAPQLRAAGGRLIYPDTLRLLPLYALAITKATPLRGGFQEVSPDERSFVGYELMTLSVPRLLKLLYPTLFRVDGLPPEVGRPGPDGALVVPAGLPLSAERLDVRGAFLLDDGLRLVLWLGKQLPSDYAASILGAEAAGLPDLTQVVLTPQKNATSQQLMALIAHQRQGAGVYPPLVLVRQGEPREALFYQGLVEDRGIGGVSYIDWLSTLHRQVQQKA